MCTKFIEIKLLDVGTDIHTMLSVSVISSAQGKERYRNVPSCNHMKGEHSHKILPCITAGQEMREKRVRECVGNRGEWAIHPN